jgi:hypothetical protein
MLLTICSSKPQDKRHSNYLKINVKYKKKTEKPNTSIVMKLGSTVKMSSGWSRPDSKYSLDIVSF